MKVLCTVRNVDDFLKIKDFCDGVVMSQKTLSSRYDSSLTNEEILQIVKKCNTNRMEAYLMINDLFTDETIKEAYKLIEEFKDTNLMYIFGDLGIYQILKEFNITKKGVYNPDTLISNYVDFEFWRDLKIRGLYPTLEIPLNDIAVIGKNKKVKLYYKGFGKAVMFHSKRKLLTNYKNYKNIPYALTNNNDLTLVEETRQESYKILENEHGTHIFQPGVHNILPALDIIVDELDYLFLDGTYLNYEDYLKAVEIYKEALCDIDHLNLYNARLEKIFNDLTYNFMYEDSVFRKGDF